MSELNFTSQVCTTKEQSEQLLKLGLKKETSDLKNVGNYDAWSLHRLIQMLPDKIAYPTIYDSANLIINKDSLYYKYRYFDRNGDEDFICVGYYKSEGTNIYDYIVSIIEWLINEGYFNKEYLE